MDQRYSVRAAVAAIAGPGLVTLLALLEQRLPTATAALLYVLCVAVVAAVAGAPAGVAASFLSFLTLNFFFTPPLHTFVVGKPQDLVALIVFLLVSVIIGLLLSRATRERSRAETNRLRAALFSGVTHDLKTPLSAITASVTSLLEGTRFTDEERHEHLDTIRLEAEHLNRVVTNLMDLARLRAGALVPSKVPAAIDELIEAVVARMRPAINGRAVHLDLRGDLPEMPMDIVQIDQVLTNLIENATKFSPPSSPIYISAEGSSDRIKVTVADRGPGIPDSDRERIFQAFERGDGEVAGTGLGLALARSVVVAHGGRIWAEDDTAGGAAITFELPTEGNSE